MSDVMIYLWLNLKKKYSYQALAVNFSEQASALAKLTADRPVGADAKD